MVTTIGSACAPNGQGRKSIGLTLLPNAPVQARVAKRSCGLEVDSQFVFVGPFNGEIPRVLAPRSSLPRNGPSKQARLATRLASSMRLFDCQVVRGIYSKAGR